jgi:hypothetical protein
MRDSIAQRGKEELGVLVPDQDFNPLSPEVTDHIQNHSYRFSFATNTQTQEHLKRELRLGLEAGEGTRELTERVNSVFNFADTTRAVRIARTETVRAFNAGAEAAYTQSGVVQGKEWLSEFDHRRCPFCKSMDKKVARLNQRYFNQGDILTVEGPLGKPVSMNLNYSEIKHPPLHPHCRCTLIPVLTSGPEPAKPRPVKPKPPKPTSQSALSQETINQLKEKYPHLDPKWFDDVAIAEVRSGMSWKNFSTGNANYRLSQMLAEMAKSVSPSVVPEALWFKGTKTRGYAGICHWDNTISLSREVKQNVTGFVRAKDKLEYMSGPPAGSRQAQRLRYDTRVLLHEDLHDINKTPPNYYRRPSEIVLEEGLTEWASIEYYDDWMRMQGVDVDKIPGYQGAKFHTELRNSYKFYVGGLEDFANMAQEAGLIDDAVEWLNDMKFNVKVPDRLKEMSRVLKPSDPTFYEADIDDALAFLHDNEDARKLWDLVADATREPKVFGRFEMKMSKPVRELAQLVHEINETNYGEVIAKANAIAEKVKSVNDKLSVESRMETLYMIAEGYGMEVV